MSLAISATSAVAGALVALVLVVTAPERELPEPTVATAAADCLTVVLPSGTVIDAAALSYNISERRVTLTPCVLFADSFEPRL